MRQLGQYRMYVYDMYVTEQLARSCYLIVERPGVEPATFAIISPRC